MLKIKTPTENIVLKNLMISEDGSSDRDFYNAKLLNLGVNGLINKIVDSEIFEYKPETSSELNFNLFFLRYFNEPEINNISNFIESDFKTHVKNTEIAFGIKKADGTSAELPYNHVFEIKQPSSLREPTTNSDRLKNKLTAVNGQPYTSNDTVGEAMLINPEKSGLPIFYNTFAFPFYGKKDVWGGDKMLYKNKPFFYNSFLLFEVFDSPIGLTQNRIQSIASFVSNKSIREQINGTELIINRPCFNLTEGCDGYSFFFLDNYPLNEFYVRFSFWDALNGEKIQFIPSSNQIVTKKWFQMSDSFKQEFKYLKYVLDYNTKTYTIFEFNSITNDYDLENTDFDLYEMAFDPFYERIIVPNQKPNDVTISTVINPVNPFSFNIKNLISENYLGDKHSLPVNNSLDGVAFLPVKPLINSFAEYNKKTAINKFTKFVYTDLDLPVYDIKLNGFNGRLKTFYANNIDDNSWNIRKIALQDIKITTDTGITLPDTIYKDIKTPWNDPKHILVSEALTIFSSSYNTPGGMNAFGRKIMDSVDCFESLIKEIEIGIKKGYYDDKKTNFLFTISKELSVKMDDLSKMKSSLIQAFNTSKVADREKYLTVKSRCADLLYSLFNIDHDDLIVNHVMRRVNYSFSPLDYPELIADYVNYGLEYTLTSYDMNVLKNMSLDSLVSIYDSTQNIRDYLIDVFIVCNGNSNVLSGDRLKFDFYFNVGKKVAQNFSNTSEIRITGKVKMSLINEKNEIKNIIIPINTGIKSGKKIIQLSTDTITPLIDTLNVTT